MKVPSYPDCVLLAKRRLEWARHRIYQFNAEVDLFLEQGHYSVFLKEETIGDGKSRARWFFVVGADVPYTLRFCAGDAVHSLRAVVDYLVRGIGVKYRVDRRLALEFKNGPEHFANFVANKNWERIPAPIGDWYMGEQTYLRRDRTPSLLHALNKIWNEDKHSAPVLLASAIPEMAIGRSSASFNIDEINVMGGGPLENGAEIMNAVMPSEHIVHFHPDFTIDVSFYNSERARSFFYNVVEHIDKMVIPQFEPFLT